MILVSCFFFETKSCLLFLLSSCFVFFFYSPFFKQKLLILFFERQRAAASGSERQRAAASGSPSCPSWNKQTNVLCFSSTWKQTILETNKQKVVNQVLSGDLLKARSCYSNKAFFTFFNGISNEAQALFHCLTSRQQLKAFL